MTDLSYRWQADGEEHDLRLAWVASTDCVPFRFGGGPHRKPVDVAGFFVATTPVTQALWSHVMGVNPAKRVAPRSPVENVAWNEITAPNGFLERLNAVVLPRMIDDRASGMRFRLSFDRVGICGARWAEVAGWIPVQRQQRSG